FPETWFKAVGKRQRRVLYQPGASPQENRPVIPARAESPYYQDLFPLSHSPGLQPLHEKGHLSWGDASLAPGWYKFAPLALNYGF
ncbi:MAG TPA: hypothetical protein PLA90_19055, partial [Candidatus Sumerlaeota bacterium]|nr:hypothetical protein [Candidatus Sumerlaeota bacterium]